MSELEYAAALRCLVRGSAENAEFTAQLSHAIEEFDAMELHRIGNLLCQVASSALMTSLSNLPRELVTENIAVQLRLRDLANLSLCCKSLNEWLVVTCEARCRSNFWRNRLQVQSTLFKNVCDLCHKFQLASTASYAGEYIDALLTAPYWLVLEDVTAPHPDWCEKCRDSVAWMCSLPRGAPSRLQATRYTQGDWQADLVHARALDGTPSIDVSRGVGIDRLVVALPNDVIAKDYTTPDQETAYWLRYNTHGAEGSTDGHRRAKIEYLSERFGAPLNTRIFANDDDSLVSAEPKAVG